MQLQFHDGLDVLLRERVEDNDLVDAVQKLRPEGLAHLIQHLDSGHLELRRVARLQVLQESAPQIAGHDDHGILEIHGAPVAIGEPAVLEDLQQNVEHVAVRLLDLVEQHDAIRPPAHGLGELPAFLKPDVARRRADEPADGVLLLVLRHIQAHHRVLIVKQVRGQGAAQFGLAHAGGPQEQE